MELVRLPLLRVFTFSADSHFQINSAVLHCLRLSSLKISNLMGKVDMVFPKFCIIYSKCTLHTVILNGFSVDDPAELFQLARFLHHLPSAVRLSISFL